MITQKYRITPGIPNLVHVPTSAATQFLGAGYVGGLLFVFTLINPEDPPEPHEFLAVSAVNAHLDPSRTHKFVGTASSNEGSTIHHVFRRIP